MEASNLSYEEQFRMTGTLRKDQIIELLDSRTENIEFDPLGAIAHIEESSGSLPDEGFLSEVSNRLSNLEKNLRGQNKEELKSIIALLDDLGMTLFYNFDYARSEMTEAIKCLRIKK